MKKIIALFLSLIMTFAVASPVYAISNDYSSDESSILANFDVQEKLENILRAVEPQKALFGMSNVDFANVQIGEEIPVYETYSNRLVSSELHIAPILLDGEIISLFYIMQSENDWVVQLGKGLVSKIKAYANNSPFAIIYASEGAYVFTDGEYHLIAESDCNEQTKLDSASISGQEANCSNLETISRTSISSIESADFSNIICKNVSDSIAINATPEGPQLQAVSPSSYDVFCSICRIQQPSKSWFCWACCIASMVNYMYDGNETYQSIAYLFNHYTDEGLTLAEIVDKFNTWFDADYVDEYDDHISQTFAYNELKNDRLILGAYSYAGYGHAVVICGINKTVKSYAFMDPAVGEYCAGTIYTTSGSWCFISESSGNRFTMLGYGCYDG